MAGLPKRLIISLIAAYQYVLSPLFGNRCRFHPSCSRYTREAVEKHGALAGSLLGLRRICRCHHFHEGGIDPVPDHLSTKFLKP